jgi:hypothetical protein
MIARLLCGRLLKVALDRVAHPALGSGLASAPAQGRFGAIVRSFLAGFQAGCEGSDLRGEQSDPEWRGFYIEGVGMGLAMLDWLTPWKRDRWRRFAREANGHIYMLHVGAGWAMARVPCNPDRFCAHFDPLLRWLLLDGFGFHEGFFHPKRSLFGQPHPARLTGYAKRAFDQGLGRVMWFASGADVRAVAKAIARFSEERRGDLWSGAGLAITYAGQATEGDLEAVVELAGEARAHLAQGAAFGAKARIRAGNRTDYQELACRLLCGMSAAEAAAITDRELPERSGAGIPTCWNDGVARTGAGACLASSTNGQDACPTALPDFEIWRVRIQQRFASMNKTSLRAGDDAGSTTAAHRLEACATASPIPA